MSNERAISIEDVYKNLIFRAVPSGKYVYGENEDAIYKTYGDVSLYYYFIYSYSSEFGLLSGRLTRDMVDDICKRYDMTEDDLAAYTYENTDKLLTPSVIDMSMILYGETDITPLDEYTDDIFSYRLPYLGVTFASNINGATAIFLPRVADKICDIFDGDILIAFTSVHEAMIHPLSSIKDTDQILGAVTDTMDLATNDNDILTKNLFIYRKETKTYECIETKAKADKIVC